MHGSDSALLRRSSLLGVLDILGAMYSCVIFLGIFNCNVAIPTVVSGRALFYRERAAGMYGVIPYVLTQGLSELPYIAVQALVYSAIVYFLIQFEATGAKFGWFLLFLFLNLLSFTSFGQAMAVVSPSAAVAIASGGLFLMFWNVFCGFLVYKKVCMQDLCCLMTAESNIGQTAGGELWRVHPNWHNQAACPGSLMHILRMLMIPQSSCTTCTTPCPVLLLPMAMDHLVVCCCRTSLAGGYGRTTSTQRNGSCMAA